MRKEKDVTTLLIDYNNLCFRNLFTKDISLNTPVPDFTLWRYKTYNAIYQNLLKMSDVNEVVIAADDKNSWRKSYFPRYKESRKTQRDKSTIEWDIVYDMLDDLLKDLRHYMPFKTIKVNGAEADDVIAIICKNINSDCIISSGDEDFLQLISKRAKVWNPSKNEYIENVNKEHFIVERCLTGQKKDDIFNIKTSDDWGLTEETKDKRKPGFGKKSAETVMKGDYVRWLKDMNLLGRFHRNRVLIDFDYIPNTIIKRVMKAYNNISFPPPQNIYQFFKKHNMRGFLDDFTQTERRLLTLY